MCGRYRRRSDKQRIADAFAVSAGLEELDLTPEDDIAPGSIQPVVAINQDGERQIELMRWGFKLPDRLLFNARSEGIESSKFWKDSFEERRCIVPPMPPLNGSRPTKGRRSPSTRLPFPARNRSGWLGSGSSGRTQRPISGNGPLS